MSDLRGGTTRLTCGGKWISHCYENCKFGGFNRIMNFLLSEDIDSFNNSCT